MSDQTRKPFQFSLRTVLALLLIIAGGLGFWLQEQRLAKARRILAAHGLSLEWADLKEGEVRATVTNRVEGESFVLLTMQVEARQSAPMRIKKNGTVMLGVVLEQTTSDESWTGEVQIFVDKVRRSDRDGDVIIKRVLSVDSRGGSAQAESFQTPPGDPKLTEFVKVHAEGSEVIEFGKPIPLIDIGTEKFELVVE